MICWSAASRALNIERERIYFSNQFRTAAILSEKKMKFFSLEYSSNFLYYEQLLG